MDPEFKRAITVVLLVGSAIAGIGVAALYLVFRGFAGAKAGGRTHIALIAGLLSFVMACCIALFALSYAE